jgi:hypothetical protein
VCQVTHGVDTVDARFVAVVDGDCAVVGEITAE